jgi:HemY protein
MIRIVLFLILIALAAAGAAWIAEQPGDFALSWRAWRVETSLPVFVLALGVVVVAAMLAWSSLRRLWRTPQRMRHRRHEKRRARGRHAITHGLLAIGHGDSGAARAHAEVARRHADHDPLALLLYAQSAQLDGDREGAQTAFRAMTEREDTRLLGLRGLFVEAQRADDSHAAQAIAEQTLQVSPGSTWASQAVLGFRCAGGDWSGALSILDKSLASGLIDKSAYRRQRAVLLTACALELENHDRDVSRESAMEAVKLAPTLVPAAVLASKYLSEANQIRRAMRIIEAAWLVHPHPDLADAYAHVKLGDSARQRLVRIETLADKAPRHIESALAMARAAIDASEFARAREALTPFIAAPTQRVAMLMAEIERTEHGDSGRARAWTRRAVRALHDPVWTADGYVSDVWRAVSPVTGRLDAFEWKTPLAALPSDRTSTIETDIFESEILRETVLAPPRAEPVAEDISEAATNPATQDNSPNNSADANSGNEEQTAPAPAASRQAYASPPRTESVPPAMFRSRQNTAKATSRIPAVIPIVRAPDDPGIDDERPSDEFAEPEHSPKGQASGWRGFLSRWGA